MTAALLDGNVLVALTISDHVHHSQAWDWFDTRNDQFATCPITQGTLLRYLLRAGETAQVALEALNQIVELPQHVFWPDEIGYSASMMAGVIGHRQVMDAYLVELASYFGGSLVTFDKGLGALRRDSVELIPT